MTIYCLQRILTGQYKASHFQDVKVRWRHYLFIYSFIFVTLVYFESMDSLRTIIIHIPTLSYRYSWYLKINVYCQAASTVGPPI